MLNHEEILKLRLIKSAEGHVINVDTETNKGFVVFTEGSVDPDCELLLQASAIIYKNLSLEKDQLKQLIEISKIMGAEGAIPKFEEMLRPIELALDIALNGLDSWKGDKQ